MQKRVADIIMETLVEYDISDCFAVVGGGAMHLNNALAQCEYINKYFNHHEQACAMAAEAYARVSGRMAAICVTSGPGGTNAITGVLGAWQDSIPLLVLSGQVRYTTTAASCGLTLRSRGIQEFNIVDTVKTMTKYSVMITDPLAVKSEVIKAITIAREGRKGPVWVDVPLDVQSAVVEEMELYPCDYSGTKLPDAGEQGVDDILNALKGAKRPCILAGYGIRISNCMKEFLEVVEMLKVPVVGGAWLCDILYSEHPLYYGLSGNIGPRTGNFIIQNADVIVTLGSSISFRQTGFAQDLFAPKAKIYMVDIDIEESKKPGLNIHQFVHTDLRSFFNRLSKRNESIKISREWKDYCDKLQARFTPYEAIENISMQDRVCSYYFWKVLTKYESDDMILAMGNNTANSSKLQIGMRKKPQRALTNHTCGSMGYDLPAAIGAAIATGKEILCTTGDGSIMMNIQELQTVRHLNLPIKIIIFNNGGYGAIRQTCKNFFKDTYVGCTPESGISFPNFMKLADTFEMPYYCCETNAQLDDAFKWLFSVNEACVLEVYQRLDDPILPKVMSRLNSDGTFSTPALQDMAPFISKEELDSLMLE